MKSAVNPRITLVGAGPGDPELISVKGLKAIRRADVLLYDALVCPDLLEEAPAHAERVFVGKRAGRHAFPQEEINRLLVAYAFNHGHVVRLKGGDPYVFARGQEERDYAAAFQIPVEVIPGITSAVAVPAAAGIPVTARGVNDSFWVLTATTTGGRFIADLDLAIQSSATLVILMGRGKLAEIAGRFVRAGKGGLPVAVVQNGTLKSQRSVSGTMADIAARADAEGIGTPAVIVAGEVADLSKAGAYAAVSRLAGTKSRANGRR